MPLGVDFWWILVDLGRQNGAKLAPKSHQKSIPTSKGDFLKKPYFSLGKIHFFEIQGVEVESKNRSKIDIKNDAETEGLGNSIFIDF